MYNLLQNPDVSLHFHEDISHTLTTLYTKWLPYEDVLVLKKVEEMVEVYYNSSQFSNTLRLLEKEFDTAFAL